MDDGECDASNDEARGAAPTLVDRWPTRRSALGLWDDLRPISCAHDRRSFRRRSVTNGRAVHWGMLRAGLSMSMRVWPIFLFVACAAGTLAACITQEDPPYGGPGAIGAAKFGGGTSGSTGSTSSGGGDGGSSGGNSGPFPGAYNEANPVAPAALAPIHPGAADGGIQLQGATTACMPCHGAGGAALTKWAFAGWAASTGTTPLDKGEVIVTGTGAALHVKTSPDGYFWSPGTLPGNARTAVRDKSGKVSEMGGTATADCNSAGCHGATAGPIDFRP
jgi:hypothetical protein